MMKIAEGLEILEIPAVLMNGPGVIHPSLIWDNDEVVLIDAGLTHQTHQFREAIEKAGVQFERLSKIIITHADADHVGGLAGILKESTQKITVFAHEKEKPYIEAEVLPLRLEQMDAQAAALQGELGQQMKKLCDALRANYKMLKANVDVTVDDGQVLPYCGGITVIYTPGHTFGHICIYHHKSKTLIAGDAFNVENGELVYAPAFTLFDKDKYNESIKKLTKYDIETVICYHGGVYRDNPNERIAVLAGEQ
ncbi:MBL fold metallo-hydrolase [Acetivibrio cellulolyticus]|uniref:MBL fold metallo-hydrolase n=1 Tax=Acetivibrio cellulolyticus TaxID=35830 RepID=UPI0001E2DE22|nr:MBL fold metallo-hydrolase [Acetivibrio cellulolyticus]